MDSTSPTLARVGSTSDLFVADGKLTLVERFFTPMPKPGFAAEDERTRHPDSAPGWHGTADRAASRGHPA